MVLNVKTRQLWHAITSAQQRFSQRTLYLVDRATRELSDSVEKVINIIDAQYLELNSHDQKSQLQTFITLVLEICLSL